MTPDGGVEGEPLTKNPSRVWKRTSGSGVGPGRTTVDGGTVRRGGVGVRTKVSEETGRGTCTGPRRVTRKRLTHRHGMLNQHTRSKRLT